ncbi:MAG: sodium-dependent transporter [Lachnospiraceae bacterium]|nr:sodium-dependent transporter [Lachnospiraceae bacterium]
MKEKKEGFGSKVGFILAAAGSAVGLGNIWRFPYLAAKYGGGIFLLIYIVLVVTFGFALMVTEISLGRKTGKSVIGAYKEADKRFGFLGPVAALVPFIITPYYCVIGGWVIRYLVTFTCGNGSTATNDDYFGGFISSLSQSSVFFLIFAALTALIVIFGVEKGIESVSKILMPILIILSVVIAIYTMTLPGSGAGLKYYLLPNFEGFTLVKLMKTIVAAMGQLFYSMSLAMGIMVTYGSYMRKQDSVEGSTRQISFFDTLIAILAGLIIVPSVVIFSGGDAAALNAGPGLMFVTLPKVFDSMKGGHIVGSAFFILVAFAALTSSVSLLETMVSIVTEKFHLKRMGSTIVCLLIVIVMGMLSVLGYSNWSEFTIFGYQILDFFDLISNNIMMPIVALLTSLLIGYVVKPKYIEEETTLNGETFKSKGLYEVMIKFVCPVFMIIILLTPFFVEL